MFRKLLPRNDNFFAYFERHAAVISKGAKGLLAFNHSPDPYPYIKACEEEADEITHQCIEALHKNFITPFERGDIHRLVSTMDDIMDAINDVGKFLLLYKLKLLEKESFLIAKIIVEASEQVALAVGELKKKRRTEAIKSHLLRISVLEQEADGLFVKGLARLFDEEKEVVLIIKWKEIYEHLEEAVNACDDVANILEGIMLENE